MVKVLALIGSNFLGHVTNVIPICKELELNGYEIHFCVIPLSKSKISPPVSVKYIRDNQFSCDYINEFTLSNTISPPVFNYDDLLFQLNFTNEIFIEKYFNKINFLVEKHKPKIIISDFVFFCNLVAKKENLLHIAIRSHGLQVKNNKEYFNWWDKETEEIKKHKREVINSINKNPLFSINSISDILYGDFVVTAGFSPFDQIFPKNVKNHYFFSKKINSKNDLPNKTVYLYVRNLFIREKITAFLNENGISYFDILQGEKETFIDIWSGSTKCKFLISHGGHGMCMWAAHKKVYHIILSDNDDRKSNGLRAENLSLGVHFDVRNELNTSLFNQIGKIIKDEPTPKLYTKKLTLNSKEIAYEIIKKR